ncbi:hypothetical protein M422DRAFT_107595, partial [Sphaerobolus stellatus SS14]
AGWDDPNLDDDAIMFEDDSPYPEVRASVSNCDDPDMPASTLRAWLIGVVFAVFIPGLNQFFYFRYPSVTISSIAAQLMIFPIGRLWGAIMPDKKIFGLSINPGQFTIKEHVLTTVMATVAGQSAYATDLIAVQRVFYQQTWGFMYQWLIVMSTQLMGFSLGGIARRFLVAPPSMIWPANLVSCALFNTLHSQYFSGQGNRDGITRERFFLYVFLGSFFWYFVPGYLFGALSYFAWVTWIFPKSATVGALFGYHRGMGMSVITFDWAQIAYIGSPLAIPWWAAANVFAGFVVIFWIIAPAIYLGVQAWMFTNIKDMCNQQKETFFICPGTEVFGTASIVWGVIGPARQFSRGEIYYPLVFFFLIGAFLPIIPYMITRRYPSSWARYVNFPVLFSGTGLIPPATALNFVPWALISFIFQYVIRRRHFSWWAKYNYVLSAGLDAGVAISVIVIFFTLQFPKHGSIGSHSVQTWWGNKGFKNTVEWNNST